MIITYIRKKFSIFIIHIGTLNIEHTLNSFIRRKRKRIIRIYAKEWKSLVLKRIPSSIIVAKQLQRKRKLLEDIFTNYGPTQKAYREAQLIKDLGSWYDHFRYSDIFEGDTVITHFARYKKRTFPIQYYRFFKWKIHYYTRHCKYRTFK